MMEGIDNCLPECGLIIYTEMSSKKDVVYYFDEMIGTYHYAFAHPMKPLRVAMTDEIVRKYQLDQHFDTIVPLHPSRT